MLSRVATPSTFLTTRAFSTSLAFRADFKKPEAAPVRMNPLVGNVTRLSTPEPKAPEKAPEAPKPQTTPAQTTTTPSDLPPPSPSYYRRRRRRSVKARPEAPLLGRH
ncbi:hypothetical protein CEP52_010222 [Fusarium oligoseptatum]|uniref:Uncharacterized protein n=1 Tax=Fusarium oligoseptatum TaxID=2604345 RepID=A0A428T9E8_9HYPO|nr:hypothetical protein CEP52_010222 [Fusarium oligoseptatum]